MKLSTNPANPTDHLPVTPDGAAQRRGPGAGRAGSWLDVVLARRVRPRLSLRSAGVTGRGNPTNGVSRRALPRDRAKRRVRPSPPRRLRRLALGGPVWAVRARSGCLGRDWRPRRGGRRCGYRRWRQRHVRQAVGVCEAGFGDEAHPRACATFENQTTAQQDQPEGPAPKQSSHVSAMQPRALSELFVAQRRPHAAAPYSASKRQEIRVYRHPQNGCGSHRDSADRGSVHDGLGQGAGDDPHAACPAISSRPSEDAGYPSEERNSRVDREHQEPSAEECDCRVPRPTPDILGSEERHGRQR